jgi:dethiobiotin synthetase
MNLFITGIGTNVGKTIVSAVFTETLQADYWKPIQSGVLDGKDSDTVKSLITNTKSVFHPESFLLNEPLSPHFAAKLDGVEIELEKIQLPKTTNHLIIEGAGGLLVPINDTQYVIDIAKQLDCEIVLVISSYLGCINHSLLSIDYLKRNNFKLKALVFNGEFETEVKQSIVNYYPNPTIIDIHTLNTLNKSQIKEVSDKIKAQNAL